MNALRDLIDKATSAGIPAWAMGAAVIVLPLVAMKVARGFLKFVFFVLTLAALAGAGWWYFHRHARI